MIKEFIHCGTVYLCGSGKEALIRHSSMRISIRLGLIAKSEMTETLAACMLNPYPEILVFQLYASVCRDDTVWFGRHYRDAQNEVFIVCDCEFGWEQLQVCKTKILFYTSCIVSDISFQHQDTLMLWFNQPFSCICNTIGSFSTAGMNFQICKSNVNKLSS